MSHHRMRVDSLLFLRGMAWAMKKPTLRVTKWLADIPVEAHCTHCPRSFKAQGTSHRPSREEYQKSLQNPFDAHCKEVHSEA
jgi:hypothetical protein